MLKIYDLLILGGGSGGVSAAFAASKYSKSVGIIETGNIGGTCVNLGCVPKKATWYASNFLEDLKQMNSYGFSMSYTHSYNKLKQARDLYISQLQQSFTKSLSEEKIDLIKGEGFFRSPTEVQVGKNIYAGRHVIIATGSKAEVPEIKGKDLILTSDDFFKLKTLPESVLIIGGGYIATELAGIFNSFSVKTSLSIRGQALLSSFDHEISAFITKSYKNSGVQVLSNSKLEKIEKLSNGKFLAFFQDKFLEFDLVFSAIGRTANLNFGVENIGLRTSNGAVWTDEWNKTSLDNLYAVGDVTGNVRLTPVANMTGKKLVHRLFGGINDRVVMENIPTVVFSHPPVASVGLSEVEARKKYQKVQVFTSVFSGMFHSVAQATNQSFFKMICAGEELKVVGLHAVGKSVDEAIQGFAVAIKMGACKKDFDETFAIHPTVAEEFLTMG